MRPKFEIGQVVYLLERGDKIREALVQGVIRYGGTTAESEYCYFLEEEHDEYDGKSEYNEDAIFSSRENLVEGKVEELRKKLQAKN